jgi:hypothetical protein
MDGGDSQRMELAVSGPPTFCPVGVAPTSMDGLNEPPTTHLL